MPRPHDPIDCVTCDAITHLAPFGESPWQVALRLGITGEALAAHVRKHPHLGGFAGWVLPVANATRTRRKHATRQETYA